MSHIDEGPLHAYLDGETAGAERSGLEQHLEGCPECRSRLEEARVLRERSAGILSGSGPATVTPPPFEQVVARARAVEARQRVFRLNRLTALGWAATIVLAVGVGWIARGTLGLGEPPRQERDVAVVDSAAPRMAERIGEPKPSAGAVGRALQQEPALESDAESRRMQRRDEPAPAGAAKSEVAPAGRAEGELAEAQVGEARAKLSEAEVERQPAPGVAALATPPPSQARARGAHAQADSVEWAQDERKAGQAAAAEDTFAALRQVDLDALIGTAGAGAAWREADEETARDLLGGPATRLPNAAVVAYLVPSEEDQRAVQVVQRLATGDVVVLMQQPVAAVSTGKRVVEPAEERPARDELMAMNEPASGAALASVSVRRGDYVLTLRGRLPTDSLLALLETLP